MSGSVSYNLMKKAEEQLRTGERIEEEHEDTIKSIVEDAQKGQVKPLGEYYRGIAKDHTKEHKDYYNPRLVHMEEEAKKEEEGKMSQDISKQKVKKFFTDRQSAPKDDEVHAFAEENKANPHKLENKVYSLLTNALKGRKE